MHARSILPSHRVSAHHPARANIARGAVFSPWPSEERSPAGDLACVAPAQRVPRQPPGRIAMSSAPTSGQQYRPEGEYTSSHGWALFVAAYLVIAGVLNVIWGIVALDNKSYFVSGGLLWSELNTWVDRDRRRRHPDPWLDTGRRAPRRRRHHRGLPGLHRDHVELPVDRRLPRLVGDHARGRRHDHLGRDRPQRRHAARVAGGPEALRSAAGEPRSAGETE